MRREACFVIRVASRISAAVEGHADTMIVRMPGYLACLAVVLAWASLPCPALAPVCTTPGRLARRNSAQTDYGLSRQEMELVERQAGRRRGRRRGDAEAFGDVCGTVFLLKSLQNKIC